MISILVGIKLSHLEAETDQATWDVSAPNLVNRGEYLRPTPDQLIMTSNVYDSSPKVMFHRTWDRGRGRIA